MSNAAANAPVLPSAMSNSASNTSANAVGRGDSMMDAGKTANEKSFALDGVTAEAPKPSAAAAPPPPPGDQPVTGRDEQKARDEKLKEENKDLRLSKQESDDRMAREAVPQTAKKTGPNRAAGPRQNTQDNTLSNQTSSGMVSGIKTAGGKKFESRNGVSYDTAYHGQATTNVRRGTDAYNKLDGGLRSIADTLGGTVVIVWKEKAYRIQ